MVIPLIRAARVTAMLVGAAVFAFAYAPESTLGEREEPGTHVPGEVLVKFRPGTSGEAVRSATKVAGATEDGEIPQIGVKKLKVPEHAVETVVEALNHNPNVEFAELNYLAEVADLDPNDPHWPAQWGPQKVQAPKAWEVTTGDETVVIAVVDTGVYAAHPDLAGRVLPGYDFADDDFDATDDQGHGTMVAGIIAASTNNGLGVAGLTWSNSILPVKVCHGNSCSYDDLAEGIIYAADEGVKVISVSIGGEEPAAVLKLATEYAWERGAVLVASAGNRGTPSVSYPARFQSVLAVGSSDRDDQRSSFSNYGEDLDLLAPGESIRTTFKPDGYMNAVGTSFAAPHVAAAAALLWSAGALSNSAVVEAILSGADDLGPAGRDDVHGNGRLNINSSLLDLDGDASPSPTSSPTRS